MTKTVSITDFTHFLTLKHASKKSVCKVLEESMIIYDFLKQILPEIEFNKLINLIKTDKSLAQNYLISIFTKTNVQIAFASQVQEVKKENENVPEFLKDNPWISIIKKKGETE